MRTTANAFVMPIGSGWRAIWRNARTIAVSIMTEASAIRIDNGILGWCFTCVELNSNCQIVSSH